MDSHDRVVPSSVGCILYETQFRSLISQSDASGVVAEGLSPAVAQSMLRPHWSKKVAETTVSRRPICIASGVMLRVKPPLLRVTRARRVGCLAPAAYN